MCLTQSVAPHGMRRLALGVCVSVPATAARMIEVPPYFVSAERPTTRLECPSWAGGISIECDFPHLSATFSSLSGRFLLTVCPLSAQLGDVRWKTHCGGVTSPAVCRFCVISIHTCHKNGVRKRRERFCVLF